MYSGYFTMSTSIHSKMRYRSWVKRAGVVLLILGTSFSAFATLGGTLDSVQTDQASMKATMKITQARSYAVHEVHAPTGTVVREYVSLTGRVFGVAWQGPFVPDMRQLLGTYFDQYSAAAKAQRESHVGRRPLNIQEPGLVVQTAGHMRAYYGRAFDPELLPVGVSVDDVR
jgi:Protein of unknown function (DUF2844)